MSICTFVGEVLKEIEDMPSNLKTETGNFNAIKELEGVKNIVIKPSKGRQHSHNGHR